MDIVLAGVMVAVRVLIGRTRAAKLDSEWAVARPGKHGWLRSQVGAWARESQERMYGTSLKIRPVMA